MMTFLVPREIGELRPFARRAIWGIAIAACLLRLFFWAYTGRTWEDALITVLHSENVGRGLGLTHHHPGYGPVHGFTSPASVLIPLLVDAFHPGWGLHLLKLVSALVAIPTVLLAAGIALHQSFRVSPWLVFLLCGYLAFEHHQILWGMAGMETQFAVFVLFLTMYHALTRRTLALGIAMALCMYARPDYAMFLALVAVYLLVVDRKVLWRSGVIAAAIYAPWIIFAMLYYGSPVPNTVVAKWLGYPLWTRSVPWLSREGLEIVWSRLSTNIFLPLGPSFAGHGSGFLRFRDDGWISLLALLALIMGAVALVRRFKPFHLVPLGFVLAYTGYYVFWVHGLFGWYLVPFNAVNVLALVLGVGCLLESAPRLLPAAGLLYLVPFVAILPTTFRAERGIQQFIETPVRIAIGRYLFEHKKPGDRVGCEPLGFIGYYSRMPVLDYPGLASPEVTRFLREHPNERNIDSMLAYFKPEWIVLREHDYRGAVAQPAMRFLATEYILEKGFHAVRAGEVFRADQNIDLDFVVLKKRS